MGKWYRLPVVKAVLVLLSTVAAVAVGVSLFICIAFSGTTSGNISSVLTAESYEDTESFDDLMGTAAETALEYEAAGRQFETEGKYDPDKLVDIVDYNEFTTITGENTSGIAYRLGDLIEMGYKIWNNGTDRDQKIVVCQREDGSYHYYYWEDFRQMVRDGTMELSASDGYFTTAGYDNLVEEMLNVLENDESLHDYWGGNIAITDTAETASNSGTADAGDETAEAVSEGEDSYRDAWIMYAADEEFKPDGAESILDIVNSQEIWNGELENILNDLENTAIRIYDTYNVYQNGVEEWTEGNTNFTWLLVDMTAKQVYTNNSKYEDYRAAEENIRTLAEQKNTKYVIVCPKLEDFETNIAEASATEWRRKVEAYSGLDDNYFFAAAVDTTYPIQDVFYSSEKGFANAAPYLNRVGMISVIGLLLFVTALVWLTLAAGRRANDEELYLNGFDRWKTELGAAAVILPWIVLTVIWGSGWNGIGYTTSYNDTYSAMYYVADINSMELLALEVYIALTVLLFWAGYLSLVRRIKGKTVWKNSILWQVIRLFRKFGGFLREVWRGRSVVWHTVIAFGGVVLVHWVAWICAHNGLALLLMLAVEAAAGYVLLRDAMEQDKIKKGVQELSDGNMDYQIPLEKLHGDNLETAKAVNDVGNGLQRAVEEKMKSGRLKTDLITNVSHDIKTPLTSIINYVDLLKRENIDNPKVQEYIRILEEKAQRLKNLTEDVVEASKVSSGNIKLELMDVDLAEMVNQAVGEFTERMEANNLTMVVSMPDQPAVVHVDNRRMWRVLENVFSNAAKYAMPGTRIYIDLCREAGKVVFSMKNVSAQPLNIKAEELTERFIRGDISRSTEGSGLGLSIARTLTEMQGGTFELYLDGDLFKVTIEF